MSPAVTSPTIHQRMPRILVIVSPSIHPWRRSCAASFLGRSAFLGKCFRPRFFMVTACCFCTALLLLLRLQGAAHAPRLDTLQRGGHCLRQSDHRIHVAPPYLVVPQP